MATVYLGPLLIYLYMLRPTYSTRDYKSVRLCDGDYNTPGRCFISVNQTLNWHAADEYCQTSLTQSGHLAAVEDVTSQSLVADEARRRGWETTWTNGQLKNQFWLWQKHWSYLSYQGCWNDDPANPDLPIILPVTTDTKPSDCLKLCGAMGGNDDWHMYTVGIQKDADGNLVCRCDRHWTKKYSRSYNSSCYEVCPGSSIFRGGDIIDKYCGSYRHQLIYFVEGSKFHAFAHSSSPSNNHCVVMNPNNDYQWTEHDCRDPQPFICQYGSSEKNCIQQRSYMWANGVCVTLEMDPLSFYEAQGFCYKYRGDLLKVETAEVHEVVKGLLDGVHMFYIALTNHEWIFSYWGIVFKYYNWGTGQPSDDPGQKCLMIKGGDDYKWFNIDCQSTLPFICMVDIEEEKTTKMTTITTTKAAMTTMRSNSTGTDRRGEDEGFSRGLFIGLGAGAGGAVFIFIFVVLGICCYFRHKEKVREYEKQVTDQTPSNLGRSSYHEYTDLQTGEYDYIEPTSSIRRE